MINHSMKALVGLLLPMLNLAHGQCVCLEKDAYSERKAQLDANYPLMRSVFAPAVQSAKSTGLQVATYSEMSKESRLVSDETSAFFTGLNQELSKLILVKERISWLEAVMYLRSDGRAEFFTVDFPKTQSADIWLQPLRDSLCRWASAYQSSLRGKQPFRIYTKLNLKESLYQPVAVTPKRRQPGHLYKLTELGKTNKADTVTHINLSHQQLTEIPDLLKKVPNLRVLDLSDNELVTLPKFVSKLKHLDTLILSGNRLTVKRVKFSRNLSIRYINLQYNKLLSLPKGLAKNKSLTSLWLGHNDLSAGIAPGRLKALKHLEDLNLYEAKLTQVPKSIGNLSRLKNLDLYKNNISSLPKEIGRIKTLQILAVSHNKIARLPSEVGSLSGLQELYLGDNLLTDVPYSVSGLLKLNTLDVSGNAFEQLPNCLTQLVSLRKLNISNNHLRRLPELVTQLPLLKELDASETLMTEKDRADFIPFVKKLQERQVDIRY